MNELATGAQIASSGEAAKPKRETMRSLIDKGVEYCMPLYVDVHGVAKTKTVPIDHFDRMMRGSELFTGAALDGLGQGPHDDELAVVPDPDAVMQLPWRPNIAVIPGQLSYHEQPYPMCSRTILARQVERAAKMGLKFNLGIECETSRPITELSPTIRATTSPRPPTTLLLPSSIWSFSTTSCRR
jgi:glutamine synthetase